MTDKTMEEYGDRFHDKFLVACPYELSDEQHCELFWMGIPMYIQRIANRDYRV